MGSRERERGVTRRGEKKERGRGRGRNKRSE